MNVARLVLAAVVLALVAACSSDITAPSADTGGQARAENLSTMGSGG